MRHSPLPDGGTGTNLTVVHRLFLRMANPAYVLEKSTEFWSRFYDSGRWLITRRSDSQTHAELIGFALPNRDFCHFLNAYLVRLFALVGAKNVHWEHTRCACDGLDRCVFEGSWNEPALPTRPRLRSVRPPRF